MSLALIGFGEAAAAFAAGWAHHPADLRAYDRKTTNPATAAAKHADYIAARVHGVPTLAEALAGATAALSLVTADQALPAAIAAATALRPGLLWFDMNSVAPNTKREAARAIDAAGGRYIDAAVMAPVHPARAAAPILLSGPHATQGASLLTEIGFTNVRIIPGDVGRASALKMIRSVMVKGIEALTAECILAAHQAGVLPEILASLDASPPPATWQARADYNLDRMLQHGTRRAAEMEEVVKTLDALGTGSAMSRATTLRQHALGRLQLDPPAGLAAKIAALTSRTQETAA